MDYLEVVTLLDRLWHRGPAWPVSFQTAMWTKQLSQLVIGDSGSSCCELRTREALVTDCGSHFDRLDNRRAWSPKLGTPSDYHMH